MQNYIGQQIDRYRIIDRLGMGGMAVVYKAYDTRLEREVALKLIRVDEIPASQHERLMKRFEREAKSMAKFSHPNIVPVYDYGEVDGSPYLVMEYIPSGTLKNKTGQPVPVETALAWVTPIADALAYAHEFGVVHRDVKPSNILFDQKGRPILTDFGVAKVLETDEATLTGTGMGVGTPEYMAPEQWLGNTSAATDQYALGVVLYELLTGRKPFSADTPAALVILQATEPLPQPSKLAEGIPAEVEGLLYKALARDPQDRYEDMESFRQALTQVKEGAVASASSAQQPETPISIAQPAMESETIDEVEVDLSEEEDFNESALSAMEIQRRKILDDVATRFPGTTTTASEPEIGEDRDSVDKIKVVEDFPKSEQKKKDNGWRSILIGLLITVITTVIIMTFLTNGNRPKGSSESSNSYSETDINVYGKTATSEIQLTTHAMVQATSTRKAQITSTAKAEATATAVAAINLIESYHEEKNLVVEIDEWELEHKDDNYVSILNPDLDVDNFIVEATFINPYDISNGTWDFGILFRESYIHPNWEEYRLIIRSNKTWSLSKRVNDTSTNLDEGILNLNLRDGEENNLVFLLNENMGYLFINNALIDSIDIEDMVHSGSIKIGTGFIHGDERDGYSTYIKDLRIYDVMNLESQEIASSMDEIKAGSISINTQAFRAVGYSSYEYSVLFESSEVWENSTYSLQIDTDMVNSSFECRFSGGEISMGDCEKRIINDKEYIYCTRENWFSFYDHPEHYCVYDMRLYSDDNLVYEYDISYRFTRPY